MRGQVVVWHETRGLVRKVVAMRKGFGVGDEVICGENTVLGECGTSGGVGGLLYRLRPLHCCLLPQ